MTNRKIIDSLNVGDLIEVKTELNGRYLCNEISQREREGGARIIVEAGPKRILSGNFVRVLGKGSDPKYGPFVDSYLQIEIYGERAVYRQFSDGFKLTGWEHGVKILSIPFRNISSISVK